VLSALAQSLGLAIGAFFVFSLSRGLIGPLFATWTNQHIESQVRATVLSMQSQLDAIGQISSGPPVGVVGRFSLRLALLVSAGMLTPSLFLLYRMQRKEKLIETELVAEI